MFSLSQIEAEIEKSNIPKKEKDKLLLSFMAIKKQKDKMDKSLKALMPSLKR